MRDLPALTLLPSDPGAVLGEPLTHRIAGLVDRLATVVEGLESSDPSAAATVSFLRRWADRARSEGPAVATLWLRQPLDLLALRWGLCPAEHDLLVLAGLAEEHEGLAGTLRALHPLGEPRPTVGLAALFLAHGGTPRAEVRRLLAEGAAVRSGALHVEGSQGLPERNLVLADRLWDVLHGVDARPAALHVVDLGEPVPGLDAWLADASVLRVAHAVRDRTRATILMAGEDPVVAGARCAALLAAVGARPFAVELTLTDHGAMSSDEIALAVVHAAARDAVPVLVAPSLESGPSIDLAALSDVPGPVVVLAPPGRVRPRGLRPVLAVPLGPVPPAGCRVAWQALLPGVDADTAAAIVARTPVDPAWIAGIARDVSAGDLPATPRVVAAALRQRTGTTLPPGVSLVSPTVGWEHLVLSAQAASQLNEAVSRLAHQGTVLDEWRLADTAHAARGVRLLMTGPPGTGKSLAAEVVASGAETDLLRVDLSQVVSKWLGETEKNLGSTFAAAERTHAVLLFDEADALFGSRTEISDAHDRYANLETAYLLQRLDAFDGLAVLTTNLRHNIDAAFLRRMDFVVEFATPDEDGRRRLWQLHLPTARLGPDVDVATLARMYPVPGAWIRNAAVAASFAAAAGGDEVHQHHLTAAVRREYGKASLPYPGEPPRRTR